jgi:hypothetical protein
MHPTAGHPIVDTAIQLLMQAPEEPALAILDRTMRSHLGTHPQFSSFDGTARSVPHPCYADELVPPSPFAELVRRAFGPQLDPRELMLLALPAADTPAIQSRQFEVRERWQEVVENFAARYRLWS